MSDFTIGTGSFDDDEYIPEHEARGLPDPADLPDSDNPDDYDTEAWRRERREASERAQEKRRDRERRWEERRRQIREHDREYATPVTPHRLFTAIDDLDRADSDTLRAQAKEWRTVVWKTVHGPLEARKKAKDDMRHRLLHTRSDGSWSAKDARAVQRFQGRVKRYPID